MKKYAAMIILFIIIFGWIFLNGFRLTPLQSVSAYKFFDGQELEIVLSQSTHYGKAVLFKNKTNGSFGVAPLKKYFGFLWLYGGGTYGY